MYVYASKAVPNPLYYKSCLHQLGQACSFSSRRCRLHGRDGPQAGCVSNSGVHHDPNEAGNLVGQNLKVVRLIRLERRIQEAGSYCRC